MCDNSTVVAYVNKQGGTVSDSLCLLTGQLLANLLSRRNQVLGAEWSLHPQVARDQSAESDEGLYSNLSTIIRNKFCIVAGDFNCSVNWKTQTADAESMRLLDFANEEYLTHGLINQQGVIILWTLYFPLKII